MPRSWSHKQSNTLAKKPRWTLGAIQSALRQRETIAQNAPHTFFISLNLQIWRSSAHVCSMTKFGQNTLVTKSANDCLLAPVKTERLNSWLTWSKTPNFGTWPAVRAPSNSVQSKLNSVNKIAANWQALPTKKLLSCSSIKNLLFVIEHNRLSIWPEFGQKFACKRLQLTESTHLRPVP